MEIIEVKDKQSKNNFLNIARSIYKDDNVWVCPLDKDINDVFDPNENVYFTHGEATRWIVRDEVGKVIGRIAAFINNKTINASEHPTGGIGFFECIDDENAAHKLFDAAKKWLREKGMEAMDGPINFGETDSFWGLLVEGFTHPAYKIAYNKRYYRNLFESYGFKTYYKQEGFHLDLTKKFPERFWKIAEWVAKKPDYSFRHFTYKELDKYVHDFAEVYNEAWASFKKEDFEPMSPEYIKVFITKAKPIIEEKFTWFAYYKGKPIAIYLMYPDVNQIFKYFNGKLNLWNMLRFLYLKRERTMTRARGVLMGVIPKFQGKGIESAFMWHIDQALKQMPHYTELEFSWVGDYNPPMRKLWESVEAVSAKQYITYRYLFDRNAEFKRYPIPE
ncbi:MAG: GNAT family N-acetyltransferase [Cytophagales bacterium]|nr:GNAT family N-acetyltransferase [Cytophagales bacterium]